MLVTVERFRLRGVVETVVDFRVLGDVEARVNGQLVDLGHARQRCVLVTLLVEANHAVSADQLVDRLWGERLPPRARDTLYSYLSRLRHALAAVDDVSLLRQSGGYVLTVDPMAVDLHRFRDLVTRARAAQSEDQALSLFEQALGLWQREAFAGLGTVWLDGLRETLERERLAVELDCNDLQLRRGRHAWLLAGLSTRPRRIRWTNAWPVSSCWSCTAVVARLTRSSVSVRCGCDWPRSWVLIPVRRCNGCISRS